MMSGRKRTTRLGDRMGVTIHQSPLRFKVKRLMCRYKALESLTVEDWLIDLANSRGARVVFRPNSDGVQALPDQRDLSNEELIVALCQMNCEDRPQILRLAAQIVSGNQLDLRVVLRLAVMERATRVIKELAEQSLKVDPAHPSWLYLGKALREENKLPEPILHWTRLAEPVFAPRSARNIGWKLVF